MELSGARPLERLLGLAQAVPGVALSAVLAGEIKLLLAHFRVLLPLTPLLLPLIVLLLALKVLVRLVRARFQIF